MLKSDICFLNDKSAYNTRYRASLLSHFSRAFSVKSHGLFEIGLPLYIWALLVQKNIVSSNLKSNLVCMAFFWRRALIILNGLGRLRSEVWFRRVLILVLKCNHRKTFAVQNFADYRYLRLHVRTKNFYHVMGSGGVARNVGQNGHFVVSRNSKFAKVVSSINQFADQWGVNSIQVVGCDPDVVRRHGTDLLKGVGYQKQEDIFRYGKIFLQPTGYGEGFPHTLADAICSDLPCIVWHRDYVNFGLYRYALEFQRVNGWISFQPTQKLRDDISADHVNAQYYNLFCLNK